MRVIAPSDRSDEVVRRLRLEASVTNVVVIREGAVQPPGDVIMCDVARETTSRVLERLRDLELERDGSIALETVDTALSQAAEAAVEAAPGQPPDAVVWEEVRARTEEDAHLSFTFLAFLVIAVQIAAVGIVLDSPILLVGAMVVGPEFGPVAGLAVAAVQRRRDAAWASFVALAAGFPLAIIAASATTLVLRALGLFPNDAAAIGRPFTGSVSDPSVLSLFVALLAGVAGILSLTSAKSSALIGVLISVTTVPAAANVGVAVAFGDLTEAAGAAGQLSVNLVGLVVAGLTTLTVQKHVSDVRTRSRVT